MLPFLGDTLPNEQGRVNRYLSGLPSDYVVEVGKANTLDEAIEAAARVEDMLTKRASERSNVGERVNTSERFHVGEKRKFVGASGFSKKGRSSSNFPKKDCKKCVKHHGGECKGGTLDCYRCGKIGHKAADCRSSEAKNVECYSYHEKGHFSSQCPKKKNEAEGSTANKKLSKTPVVGRGYVMTEEEAKTTQDVVAGTLLIDSNLARVLFDSGATHSFVSYAFCQNLVGPLTTLDRIYDIEIADGSHVHVNRLYSIVR